MPFPLVYDPASGTPMLPESVQQHRPVVRQTTPQPAFPVWAFDPWTGRERHADDVRTDPYGLGIWHAHWGPMPAAPEATTATLELDDPRGPRGTMGFAEFNMIVDETCDEIRKLLKTKGGEYAGSETDRLIAFTRSGESAGVTPMQCLLIYMAKHYDAFRTYVRDEAAGRTRERSEPITGRLDDIINYCILAKAIIRANSR